MLEKGDIKQVEIPADDMRWDGNPLIRARHGYVVNRRPLAGVQPPRQAKALLQKRAHVSLFNCLQGESS